MPNQQHQAATLLQLPQPCLVQVLQCLATSHPASLFSAARAHSTLHQAAVLALSSITANLCSQQQLDSLVLYLGKHGQRVSCIVLSTGDGSSCENLAQLPLTMQLARLELSRLRMQLGPGSWDFYQAVLGAAGLRLTHLRLCDCRLVDEEAGLAAALSQLPGLLHLSCQDLYPGYVSLRSKPNYFQPLVFPTDVLRSLQQLTFLQLSGLNLPDTLESDDVGATGTDGYTADPDADGSDVDGAGAVDAVGGGGGAGAVDDGGGGGGGGAVDAAVDVDVAAAVAGGVGNASEAVIGAAAVLVHGAVDAATGPAQQEPLQPLEALTRLVHLQLDLDRDCEVNAALTAGMLAGACRLTALVLTRVPVLDPAVLQGKSLLQHLELCSCQAQPRGAAGKAELLSQLQPLTQLTCLKLPGTLWAWDGDPPRADAFAGLTASSRLQRLDIHSCTLPEGAWEHMFPPGRQLPQLQALDLSWMYDPDAADADVWSSAYKAPATAPDGSLLVSACPNLATLDMRQLRYGAAQLAPLMGLTRLQSLRLAGYAETSEQLRPAAPPPEAVRALLGLTGLEWAWEMDPRADYEDWCYLQS